jgi:adenylyltransferase/sulfurtransferase
VVGVGALGTHIAESLCRMGWGKIILIDRDFVEEDNLPRQTLFDESDAQTRLPKAIAAANKLKKITGAVHITPCVSDLNAGNCHDLLAGADIIFDGLDNFSTRYLLNDLAVKSLRPWIHAGVLGSQGQVFPIIPGKTACLRCLLPSLPDAGSLDNCDSAGVIAPAVAAISALSVAAGLKIVLGYNSWAADNLCIFDIYALDFTKKTIRPRNDCPCCTHHQFEFLDGRHEPAAISLCGRNAVHIRGSQNFDFAMLRKTHRVDPTIKTNPYILRIIKKPYDITLFQDGRAIIKGVEDLGIAKAVFNQIAG